MLANKKINYINKYTSYIYTFTHKYSDTYKSIPIFTSKIVNYKIKMMVMFSLFIERAKKEIFIATIFMKKVKF